MTRTSGAEVTRIEWPRHDQLRDARGGSFDELDGTMRVRARDASGAIEALAAHPIQAARRHAIEVPRARRDRAAAIKPNYRSFCVPRRETTRSLAGAER